jgi:hypothetical protein
MLRRIDQRPAFEIPSCWFIYVCREFLERHHAGRRDRAGEDEYDRILAAIAGEGEQSDSHEPGDPPMLRHGNLRSPTPQVWVKGTAQRFNGSGNKTQSVPGRRPLFLQLRTILRPLATSGMCQLRP